VPAHRRQPPCLCALLLALCALLLAPAQAPALVSRPITLDGPSSEILDLGGVSIASDGTGGIVYTKVDGGVPHVFAARYYHGVWHKPMRVDWDQPYDATWPRIAAGQGGRLLVVWVTQVATVHNHIRRGLMSASLAPGADQFGPSLLVDGNVGDGTGVSPSLSGTQTGQAIVAYRVVTNDFSAAAPPTTAAQLRPGDVLAEVRLARLAGPTWSRIGAINRNAAASMRPPDDLNGPQVAADPGGNAVVAWQEPDQTGTARIWLRRIFGTVPGPVLEASPANADGAPVTDDADAFSLDATAFGLARIAVRVNAGGGSALGGPRIFLATLPSSLDQSAGTLTGPVHVDGAAAPSGGVGTPSIAAVDSDGLDGSMWLAFAAGRTMRLTTVDGNGDLVQRPATGPVPTAGGAVATAVNPGGGGIAAWSARDAQGRPVVAVRQDFPSGAAQTGLVAGAQAGPVSDLSIGRADSGDAIVAFRQGDAGRFEIVTDRVTVPPAPFQLVGPADWVRPPRAHVSWSLASSSVGGLRYSVLVDGRSVARGLVRRSLTLDPRQVGSGVRQVRVLATDALGQQELSPSFALHVDGRAPVATLVAPRGRGHRRSRQVVVHVRDPQSGVAAATCSFGDNTRTVRASHGACAHRYGRAGRYTIVVRVRDRVGNRATRRLALQLP
jgi:hypothetical protein